VIVVVVNVIATCVEEVLVVGAVLVTVLTTLVVTEGVTYAGPKLAAAVNHETKTIPDTTNKSKENAATRAPAFKEPAS
jgi:hypothetical protein